MYDDSTPTPARRRPARTTLVIAAAALVATGAAGWLFLNAGSGPSAGAPAGTGTRAASPGAPAPGGSATAPGSGDDASGAGDGTLPLAGRTVVIDPGHNPGNFEHTDEINQSVDIGTNRKECDTTGTSTDAGYTEAAFTRDVSQRLRTLLKEQGATVVFTHDDDRPWGPCVDERARIGNKAAADAVVSVHADGSASGHRGFHVILPALVKEGEADTTSIVGPSRALGEDIARAFAQATGTNASNYVGDGTGLDVREDLGGLNLSTRPKVFVECGNMRDAKDAALLTNATWRQKAARGIADGISTYLRG
ncbi:N-acetylmuramoyl-L-alanine amidase [Streptomyces sp. SP18CS02]|uniref:N-acetylmuramoyl-L-alanine amidase n=1 Tax=Streptomyces sp. SP18CS02 TaxID=3002531 RepID=UPI002E79DC8F|nr:N-acetylmuramoyl-L-alanine amidase [Streptomyces sp. SP18CS02]MEE1753261.1 N-acetylmuramoyl-L-alanine amidase [Streptomyces sp. SP18CS02]